MNCKYLVLSVAVILLVPGLAYGSTEPVPQGKTAASTGAEIEPSGGTVPGGDDREARDIIFFPIEDEIASLGMPGNKAGDSCWAGNLNPSCYYKANWYVGSEIYYEWFDHCTQCSSCGHGFEIDIITSEWTVLSLDPGEDITIYWYYSIHEAVDEGGGCYSPGAQIWRGPPEPSLFDWTVFTNSDFGLGITVPPSANCPLLSCPGPYFLAQWVNHSTSGDAKLCPVSDAGPCNSCLSYCDWGSGLVDLSHLGWAGNWCARLGGTCATGCPFTEDFESGIVPNNGWSITTAGVGVQWTADACTWLAHGGLYGAWCDWTTANHDEWLITPTLDLTAFTDPVLSFWWMTSYEWMVNPYDNADYILNLSTDGGSGWTPLWSEEDEGVFTSFEWYQEEIDLSAYTSFTNVRLAWQYVGADATAVLLDDVMLCVGSSGPTSTPTAIVPTPTPPTSCPFTEDFESGTVPDNGWSITTAGVGVQWTADALIPHGGLYSAWCNWTDANHDEWLITPTLDLTAFTDPVLSFWWMAEYDWMVDPYDNADYILNLSTDGGSGWTPLWSEEDEGVFTSFEWYQEEIDLSAYTSFSNVRLAWQYVGNDSADVMLDDVTICAGSSGPTPPVTTPTPTPTPTPYVPTATPTAFIPTPTPSPKPKLNLLYSTYLGGSAEDRAYDIAVDTANCAYATGRTMSTNFPTANPYQASHAGSANYDAFVSKLSSDGAALLYSTYLGGSDNYDYGRGISVDSNGCAYVSGVTYSDNFPVINPYQSSRAGLHDAFLSKLSSSGASLVYSTYLGGTSWDLSYGVNVEGVIAYVTGSTRSGDFPIVNAYQSTHGGTHHVDYDAFVTKFSSAGNTLSYSTYLGGGGDDYGRGIAVAGGEASIVGCSLAAGFPVANPYQSSFQGGGRDAVISKLSTSGSALVFSTYLGGSNYDIGLGIDLGSDDDIYVVGRSDSTDFPTANPYQAGRGGDLDIFVARFSSFGSALIYSTYLGGGGAEDGQGISVNADEQAYVVGTTASADFPTEIPYQSSFNGGSGDVTVSKLSADGASLLYSTYLGGGGEDTGFAIALDAENATYVVGRTDSVDFPTENPYQSSFAGGTYDAFAAKLLYVASPSPPPSATPTPKPSATPTPTPTPSIPIPTTTSFIPTPTPTPYVPTSTPTVPPVTTPTPTAFIPTPTPPPGTGDVLIAVDIDGNTGFWDPTSTYESAVTAAGYTVAASIAAPEGGDIPWPVPFTAGEYDAVVVLTGENWQQTPNNISPADEAALEGYLDTGGCVLLVGQDVLWGTHSDWGNASGFFKTHLGLDSTVQDTVWDEASVNAYGSTGSILDGISFTVKGMDGGGPFLQYNLCSDTLAPVGGANPLIGTGDADPCAIYYTNGVFKTAFSTIELGATDPASFQSIIEAIMEWFMPAGPTPTPTAVIPTPTPPPPTPPVATPTPTAFIPTPTPPPGTGDVLIAVDIDGNPGFWDPTSTYESAVTAAGYTVAGSIAAPEGGDIPWPAPFTAGEYDAVVVLTGENWLQTPYNISPADEAALEGYLDTGGCVLLVGQDVLWGTHSDWGNASGFFKTHLGLDSTVQDTVWDEASVNAYGSTGSILDGISFTVKGMDGGGPFLQYNLCSDTLAPVGGANPLIGTGDADPCAIYYTNGVFKTAFSTIELGATDPASFQSIIEAIMEWFMPAGPTPTPTAIIPTPTPSPYVPTPTAPPVTTPTPTAVIPTPTPPPPTPPVATPTPPSAPPPWIYDYNGDGTSDIAIFRAGSGLWAIRGVTRVYFGSSTDKTVPADYDGDGTTDIGIFRPDSGLWALRGVSRVYFGGYSDLPQPGDYDGDGTADVGIYRTASGLWAVRGVTRIYFGGSTDEPVPGYYSGDAAQDIGIFRPTSGLWSIREVTRAYFGSSTDEPVPGDYDGDGTWAAGIFRPASGLWFIRGVTRVYFGSSTDDPISADYAGNGMNDIGIFRPTSGLWSIRGVTRAYFGGSEDIPVTR